MIVTALFNFPRRPEAVKVTLRGNPRDVERYARQIRRTIEGGSYVVITELVLIDTPQIRRTRLTIHPAAVDD